MLNIGDKAVVISVDRDDIREGIHVGDIVTIADNNGNNPSCIRANGGKWVFYDYQLKPVEDCKKDEITPKTETQPMTVNISIGAELTHITIGGKRFRLVSEE